MMQLVDVSLIPSRQRKAINEHGEKSCQNSNPLPRTRTNSSIIHSHSIPKHTHKSSRDLLPEVYKPI